MRKMILNLVAVSALLTGLMPTIAFAQACTGRNNGAVIGTFTTGGGGCGSTTNFYAIVCSGVNQSMHVLMGSRREFDCVILV